MGNLLWMGYTRLPNLTGFRRGLHALRVIRRHIERQPFVDIRDDQGLEFSSSGDKLAPTIEFEGVTFAYPSRPDVKALDTVSFLARGGELTALVGPSGSGQLFPASLLSIRVLNTNRHLIREIHN
jgi:ATP-binding cassette subfamily B (MDR/TAP) protein 1